MPFACDSSDNAIYTRHIEAGRAMDIRPESVHIVLQRDAQLFHALAAASLKALLLAPLADRGEACRTSATAVRPCKRRVCVGSALLAASVPRRALRARCACGTLRTALVQRKSIRAI